MMKIAVTTIYSFGEYKAASELVPFLRQIEHHVGSTIGLNMVHLASSIVNLEETPE